MPRKLIDNKNMSLEETILEDNTDIDNGPFKGLKPPLG